RGSRHRPHAEEGAALPVRIPGPPSQSERGRDQADPRHRARDGQDHLREPPRSVSTGAAGRGPAGRGERVMVEAAKKMAAGQRPPDRRAASEPAGPDFTIITGLSGAGRSEAARCLEDLGYFVVDNLPPTLIEKMAELAAGTGGPTRVAIVADVRGGVFFNELSNGLEHLQGRGIRYRILYLEPSDGDLVNRFQATRRRHPLAAADRV